MPPAPAGPLGNGNPCVHLGFTVSTGTAQMGQLKWTSIAIMPVSIRVEKVVRFLCVAGVGLLASWRLFQLSPIIRPASPLVSAWGQPICHTSVENLCKAVCAQKQTHVGVEAIDVHAGPRGTDTATSSNKVQALPQTKTWLGMLCVLTRVSRSLVTLIGSDSLHQPQSWNHGGHPLLSDNDLRGSEKLSKSK
jgi:hypothetical protein